MVAGDPIQNVVRGEHDEVHTCGQGRASMAWGDASVVLAPYSNPDSISAQVRTGEAHPIHQPLRVVISHVRGHGHDRRRDGVEAARNDDDEALHRAGEDDKDEVEEHDVRRRHAEADELGDGPQDGAVVELGDVPACDAIDATQPI